MFFRRPHPWDPGYALPPHVLAEPPGRGTLTTNYRPRRSIDTGGERVPPWRSGYAVPDYILEEPLGRGVHTTKQLPRRTVSALIPDALGNYFEVGQEEAPAPKPKRSFPIALLGLAAVVAFFSMRK